EALAMDKRLFPDDHSDVCRALRNLAAVLSARGKSDEAGPYSRDALAMSRRLVEAFATQKTEGETLTLVASLPTTRDTFLSYTPRYLRVLHRAGACRGGGRLPRTVGLQGRDRPHLRAAPADGPGRRRDRPAGRQAPLRVGRRPPPPGRTHPRTGGRRPDHPQE